MDTEFEQLGCSRCGEVKSLCKKEKVMLKLLIRTISNLEWVEREFDAAVRGIDGKSYSKQEQYNNKKYLKELRADIKLLKSLR